MKVAILGYGVEGRSALRYWRERGADITVFDENPDAAEDLPAGVHAKTGKGCFEKAIGFDVVVRGPAVAPKRVADKKAHVTSPTKLFFEHCAAPIIGVTGSKGKGTVSSLIFEMLTRAGVRAHLAGNIGVPMLDILPDVRPDDVVVLELSSFQLWDLNCSPHVAVILMIESEHLDVHSSLQDYLAAKANTVRFQDPSDGVIYHPTNRYAKQIAESSEGKKIRYAKAPAAHVVDGTFMIDEHKLCSTSHLLLTGEHNIENACAAITAAWQYTNDTDAICGALGQFAGLPHRLKLVAEKKGVAYYDDSIATTPGSAIAATKAFVEPKVLILGGSFKGADFKELARLIKKVHMRRVLLIGDEAERIAKEFKIAGFNNYDLLGSKISMRDIVKAADRVAEKGDKVILSPACASFGMFKNYSDRGDQFIHAVEEL